MNDILEDERDRTIFIEYYPEFRLTSIWHDNGKLENYECLWLPRRD